MEVEISIAGEGRRWIVSVIATLLAPSVSAGV